MEWKETEWKKKKRKRKMHATTIVQPIQPSHFPLHPRFKLDNI